jgi:hypothetical protein
MSVVQLNSYAEVQAFITAVLTQNNEESGVPNSPHGAFWASLTYDQFVNGNVPGVTDPNTGQPIPILVVNKASQSNLILALEGQGPLFDPNTGAFGQMPANGPPFFTSDQIQSIANWINAGCPQFAGSAASADAK